MNKRKIEVGIRLINSPLLWYCRFVIHPRFSLRFRLDLEEQANLTMLDESARKDAETTRVHHLLSKDVPFQINKITRVALRFESPTRKVLLQLSHINEIVVLRKKMYVRPRNEVANVT
jgi:hypothetical protein